MYPYPLRLHGPWELTADGQPAQRIVMPALVPANGTVLLTRRFGVPRRIDDFERIWIRADDVRGASLWRLNDSVLGTIDAGPVEFEVTARLCPRNELTVEFGNAKGAVGFAGDIALVIRCAAYLRDVQARLVQDRIVVTGLVAGECADPLEVYLLADDRSCGYSRCRAGDRLELQSDRSVDGAEVRVELVNASTIWDAVSVKVEP